MPRNSGSLPRYLTSFVGRDSQRLDVLGLISGSRLVTLAGPGGVGKTRLAVQIASDAAAELFPDRVWFVDLAELQDPSMTAQAVAIAVGVRERSGRSVVDSVEYALRRSRGLLVLDSCEHVIDCCAPLVHRLLASCPQLSALTTTQEPLGIPGEVIYRVPPLSLPTPGASAQTLMDSEAGQLFVQRARLGQPSLALTPAHVEAIVQICQRLDGLPLAVELAAGRSRFMSLREIERHLEQRFGLLKGSTRTTIPRHQTLAAMVRWSHDHLTQLEQVVFRRLSVFTGGFSQDAAQSVCEGGLVQREDMADVLERLVDKSFLLIQQGNEESTRYRMLDTLQHFGHERLADSAEIEPRNRHARYFLTMAESADQSLDEGHDQTMALWSLQQDHENIRSAINWCVDIDATAAARLCAAMGRFWRWQGFLSEGRHLTELALNQGVQDIQLQARLSVALASIAFRQGDRRSAETMSARAHDLADDAFPAALMAEILQNEGVIAGDSSNSDFARECFNSILAFGPEVGRRQLAMAYNNLAVLEFSQGQYGVAKELVHEAVTRLRAMGDQMALPAALDTALRVDIALGNISSARQYIDDAVRLSFDRGQMIVLASLLEGVAMLFALESRHTDALKLAGVAAELRERTSSESSLSWVGDRQRFLTQTRETVGDALAERLIKQGRQMSLDAAVAMVLQGPSEADGDDTEPLEPLTSRQREIAKLVARGLSNRDIASQLRISPRTVESHLDHIRQRLEIRSRVHLATLQGDAGDAAVPS